MPWLVARRAIATRWCIPPPDVDLYPAFEIANELALLALEAQTRPG